MAAFQLTRDFSKALRATSCFCKCGLSYSRSLFTHTKFSKKVSLALPPRAIKVARYYEKPKDKKGPTATSWAFLAGAASGILIGAVAYFGKIE